MVRNKELKYIPKSWDRIGEEQLRLYAQELAELYNQERGLRLELTRRAEVLTRERARLETEITERRQAEEMFRSLTNSSPIGIYLVQGRKFIFVNPRFQELTGYSEVELLGRESQSLVIPEDRETVRQNAANMLKGAGSTPYEYRTVTKSGETRRNMEIVTSVLYLGKRATLGSFMDITERKLVEKELQDRTTRLAALHQVSQAVSQSLSLETVSNIALVLSLTALDLDAGTIRYLDESTKDLELIAYYGLQPEVVREIQSRPRIRIGEGLVGKVAESGKTHVIEDLSQYEWEFYEMGAQSGFKSYVGLPLKVKDKVVGVVTAFSHQHRTFIKADIDMLTDLGNMVGMSMANARLFEQVEAKAREWEQTFDVMGDGVSIHSLDYRILRTNESLAKMLGTTTKALVGQYCYKAIHGLDRPIANCPLACGKLKKRAADLIRREPRLGNRWLHIRCSPVMGPRGQRIGMVHTVQDITEHRRADTELRKSREQLRNLTANLQAAREEEKRNIASNLHDDLGQTLTALQIDLSWLINKIPKEQTLLLQKAQSMLKLIDGADETVTRVCLELRPRLLDDLGLISAIQWQIGEFQRQTGIKCELTVNSEGIVLDNDCSIAYFRILQEALTNIARHANATRVKVNLKKISDKLVMEVIDNGRGITENQIFNNKSLGLIGMRERAYFLGGDLEIKDTPNGGATVSVIAPFKGVKQ